MKDVLDFLNNLKLNNNREWFNDNKSQYLKAKKQFEKLVEKAITEISLFDKSVETATLQNSIFRINRDTRFANDKTPYKTNFGAYIVAGGRKSPLPGYYFHIEPGASMIAGGMYMPPAPQLKAIREEIYENTQEYKRIINDSAFKDKFNIFNTEKVKTAPKGFPKDFADIELIKLKHYCPVINLSDEMVMSCNYLDEAIDLCKIIYPYNMFLTNALKILE